MPTTPMVHVCGSVRMSYLVVCSIAKSFWLCRRALWELLPTVTAATCVDAVARGGSRQLHQAVSHKESQSRVFVPGAASVI